MRERSIARACVSYGPCWACPNVRQVKTLSCMFCEAMFIDLFDEMAFIFLDESIQLVHGPRAPGVTLAVVIFLIYQSDGSASCS